MEKHPFFMTKAPSENDELSPEIEGPFQTFLNNIYPIKI